MPKTITPYLQLIRLPNVVTAGADSFAGWLLVTGSVASPERWLFLVAASMVLYASGTALNDVFDFEIDRIERPNRPLPSGGVSRLAAAWLGSAGLVIGPALAFASGSLQSGVVAAIISLCILGYNAGLKHTFVGPALMGACRGLNLLLGMSHVRAAGGPIGCAAAIAYGLYVAGITVVSRSETSGENRGALVRGVSIQNVAVLGLAAVALTPRSFPHPDADRPLIPLEGLLVLALVALAVDLAAARAISNPTPPLIQKQVKASLLALVWLHVGVVASVRGPGLAALVALFWVPAAILARWLYST
jgi:4-hydroxybenzoate polyprenyltransferase